MMIVPRQPPRYVYIQALFQVHDLITTPTDPFRSHRAGNVNSRAMIGDGPYKSASWQRQLH